MRWLKPQDEFLLNSSTASNPLQIGAVLWLDRHEVDPDEAESLVERYLADRLCRTALSMQMLRSPFDIAPASWRKLGQVDLHRHLSVVRGAHALVDVRAMVSRQVMDVVSLDGPPFRMVLMPDVEKKYAVLFLLVHHALVDGVGFQRIVQSLTDPGPGLAMSVGRVERDLPIPAPMLLPAAGAYLAGERVREHRHAESLSAARSALASFEAVEGNRQPRAPKLSLNAESSLRRDYSMLSLPLSTFQEMKRRLGGSVNDVFVTAVGGALRQFLIDQGELPDESLTALAARSYRGESDGDLGNFILSLQQAIGTHLSDPVDRFRYVQASGRLAIERSKLVEPLTQSFDRPFGSRDRRRKLAAKSAKNGGSVFPANIAVSNVPGPDKPRYLAGFKITANYPTPIVGTRRFLNYTLRRYCGALDIGIMTDAEQVEDSAIFADYLKAALDDMASAAQAVPA